MRMKLFSIAMLCIVFVTAVIWWKNRRALPDPNPRATKANFEQIENGMTMAEVKTILGEPWKIEMPDSPEDTLTLQDVQVSAIYEWSDGPDPAAKRFDVGERSEIGFAEGKVAAKKHTGL